MNEDEKDETEKEPVEADEKEAEETPAAETEGEEEAKPEAKKHDASRRIKGLSEKVRRAAKREERLASDNKALRDRLSALESVVLSKGEAEGDDFKITDETSIEDMVKWAEKRRENDRKDYEAKAKKERNETLYLAEKRIHKNFDTIVGKWQGTIEADKELMERVNKAGNPVAELYDLASELEQAEKEEAGEGEEETEDQMDAKEQLRGPRALPARGGKDVDRAEEHAAMEKKFGLTIDKKKFAELRNRNEGIRAKRRAAR